MDILMNFIDTGALGGLLSYKHIIMIIVGCIFLYLAIAKQYEPLLLVPIGFGIIVGNIPADPILEMGIYDHNSVLGFLYKGVELGIYPPLIFLGVGAMTDFSAMLSQPRLMLLGAAAQLGVFITFLGSLFLGFTLKEAAAIGIIGGADGPTSIFVASKLAKDYLPVITLAGYSYMALVPVLQPPVIRLLTTKKERMIKMPPSKPVSKRMRVMFPIFTFMIVSLIDPGALILIGMLCFGNLLRESGVTERLAKTARTVVIDAVVIILGLTVGASTQADKFLTPSSLKIFALGAFAFCVATAGGVLFAKIMNLFTKNKINPIIGAAGVSAVPLAARVCQVEGAKADPSNFLIMHAMAPNVAGVIGSAVAAGVFISKYAAG